MTPNELLSCKPGHVRPAASRFVVCLCIRMALSVATISLASGFMCPQPVLSLLCVQTTLVNVPRSAKRQTAIPGPSYSVASPPSTWIISPVM